MLEFHINDIEMLHACYMPFIDGGAIFIPSEQSVQLGESMLVLLSFAELEKTAIIGEVVWINYQSIAQRPKGFAIRLQGSQGVAYQQHFEKILMGKSSSHSSFTL